MSLLTTLSTGDDEIFALSRVISDPVLIFVRDVGNPKDVGNTLGVIPHWTIPREDVNLINGRSASVSAEM